MKLGDVKSVGVVGAGSWSPPQALSSGSDTSRIMAVVTLDHSLTFINIPPCFLLIYLSAS